MGLWQKIKSWWSMEKVVEINMTEFSYKVNGVERPLTDEQKKAVLEASQVAFQKAGEAMEAAGKLFEKLK